MSNDDLVARLVRAVDDAGPLGAPPSARRQLTAVCATLRVALGAAACSVARLEDDQLVYEAADGAGADKIVGTRLSLRVGIASYVARTGRAMAIDQVQDDPRFARDVAERTGYSPTSMLVVPVIGGDGAALGVVSVLDRTAGDGDPLAVATAAAAHAALLLPSIDAIVRLGPGLLAALAALVESGDGDLAAALRVAADSEAERNADLDDDELSTSLLGVVAAMAELRTAGPRTAAGAERILAEVAALMRARR